MNLWSVAVRVGYPVTGDGWAVVPRTHAADEYDVTPFLSRTADTHGADFCDIYRERDPARLSVGRG